MTDWVWWWWRDQMWRVPGRYETKSHLVAAGGRTACGLAIPGTQVVHADAPDSVHAACKSCTRRS